MNWRYEELISSRKNRKRFTPGCYAKREREESSERMWDKFWQGFARPLNEPVDS